MTSLPFPTFVTQTPVDPSSQDRVGLAAVGRCRFHPDLVSDLFRDVVAKNVEQAGVDLDGPSGKQLQKKYMKQGVAMAQTLLEESLHLDASVVDLEIVLDPRDLLATDGCLAAAFLDAGCQTVVTDGTDLSALEAAKIPRQRLAAHFVYHPSQSANDLKPLFQSVTPLVHSVSVEIKDITLDAILNVFAAAAELEELECVVQISPSSVEQPELESWIKQIAKKAPRGKISLTDPTARQLGLCCASCIRTDRDDGLFTTVVTTRNGEALGLVYSSQESIVASLECGRGVYFSRSRNQLWRKGDTSGHHQTLHRLDVDCDGDALRCTVTQHGDDKPAFCHLNTLTCWGNPRGILHLQETLQSRRKSAPEGSYAKRLFDDPTLLRDKLVEEAQELAEATEPDDVAGELADLLYFAMVRAVAAGVTFDDAIAELDRRSRKVTRRQGDSKAFRTAAANAILDKK